MSLQPAALQLRYLQTLSEIGGENSSTIVFPIDLIKPLLAGAGGAAASSAATEHANGALPEGRAGELPQAQ
jgi:hypothetical protein